MKRPLRKRRAVLLTLTALFLWQMAVFAEDYFPDMGNG